MPLSINVSEIHGNQFIKARLIAAAVLVVSATTFRMRSASREERDHTVVFDSAESPTACSCTCEAGVHGRACWAMARALDTLTALCLQKIYVEREAWELAPAPELVAPDWRPFKAKLMDDGVMTLLANSATPLAGHVLTIP